MITQGASSWQAIVLIVFAAAFLWVVGGLAAEYAVTLTVTPEKLASLGDTVTHVFTLTNAGEHGDTYTLDLSVPEGWSAIPIPPSLTVESGKQAVIFVNLLAPSSAGARTYEVILRAFSSADPTIMAQAVGFIHMEEVFNVGLSWEVEPPRPRPGGRVEGSVQVSNLGNAPDRYLIELSIQPEWPARLYLEEVQLAPGESQGVGFSVEVPPQAAAGTRYYFTLTVTSIGELTLGKSLTTSGRLSPPLPELVGGSLFPEWRVGLAFSANQEGDPRLSLTGRGDIPGLGDLSARLRLAMDGIKEASAQIMQDEWGVLLGQGTIAGRFLSVSGYPLFLGNVPGYGALRLLFIPERKGLSVTWSNAGWDFGFTLGSNTAGELTFQDIQGSLDFEGPAAFSGFLSTASDQTESGTAFGVDLAITFEELELGGSHLSVSPGYPGQAECEEWEVAGDWESGPFPVNASWPFSKTAAGTPPGAFYIRETGLGLGGALSLSEVMTCNLTGSWEKAWSDDSPPSTDEKTLSFSCGLQGSGDVLSWNLLGRYQQKKDLATGTDTFLQCVEAGGKVSLGPVQGTLGFTVERMIIQTGSSQESTFTVTLQFPDALVSPSLTLSGGGGEASIRISLAGTPLPDVDLGWTTEFSLCGDYKLSATLTASFPGFFPFCGPVKGQVTGDVFIDADGSGTWDPGEEKAEDVLLTFDGVEAITGPEGTFAFPPVMSGAYELSVEDLPRGLVPSIGLPLLVELAAGQKLHLWLPLRPQAWIVGSVFNDENKNGIQDRGETGLPSVTVTITGGDLVRTMRTNPNGQIAVEVRPGRYLVELLTETLPERFEPTGKIRVEVDVPEYGKAKVAFGARRKPRPVIITFGPPTAAFTFTPDQPSVGDTLILDASGSSAINAVIASYQWEVAIDDLRITASGRRVEVVLAQPGVWRVRLIVTDSKGLKAVTERVVEVQP